MWAAIIITVTLLGRWAFSVDTYAQEGGGPSPTVTPTTLGEEREEGEEDKKKKEEPPDCTDPGNAGYPECAGYRTPTPRPTATDTPRPTPTATRTPVPTATDTPEPTPTDTAAPTATDTPVWPTATSCAGSSWQRCYPWPTATDTPEPDDDTPTPTPCSRGGGTTKDSESTSQCHTSVPTPEVVVSPRPANPEFTMSTVFNNNTGVSIQRSSGNIAIFDSVPLRVAFEGRNGEEDTYMFQLDVNSRATGFYVVTSYDVASCDPRSLSSPDTEETAFVLGPTISVSVVRCGLGRESNDGFTLRSRQSPTDPVFEIGNTGYVHQALHPETLPVKFALDIESIKGGPTWYVPGYGSYYTSAMRTMVDYETLLAAGIWNKSVNHGNQILREVVEDDADAVVRLFWDLGGTGCRGGKIACVTYTDKSGSHLTGMEVWLRTPPNSFNQETRKVSEWTNDSSLLADKVEGDYYVSFPWAILHELGHTTGVNHLPGGSGFIMAEEQIRKVTLTPTPNDKHGVSEATRSH